MMVLIENQTLLENSSCFGRYRSIALWFFYGV